VTACPICSHPIPFLTVACHQDLLVCSVCRNLLKPDRRSIAGLYAALGAYATVMCLLLDRVRGLDLGWAVFVGTTTAVLGALVAASVFTLLVRYRVQPRRRA